MSDTPTPIRPERRRDAALLAAGGLAVALCALWALAPLPRVAVSTPEVQAAADPTPTPPAPPAPPTSPVLAELDVSAFSAPLWVAPPPPPPPPPAPTPAAPPPPLKLQLIAIVREGPSLEAVLYDPDADRLLVVAEGGRVGARTVERVTESGVEIRDGSGVRKLALREGGSP